MTTQEILQAAKAAKGAFAAADTETRNRALEAMAGALLADREAILAANALDLEAAQGSISTVMQDRLRLTDARLEEMAAGVREVAALPDPVGQVLARVERPNGLVIKKTAVPMGVVAIIYESRPNVTSDAAALAVKSGNACVLRVGKEAWRSADAITRAMRRGLAAAGLPEDGVALVQDTTRASSRELMEAVGLVDLLIPRGGAGLIKACVARCPASRPAPASAMCTWTRPPTRTWPWIFWKTPRPAAPAYATRRRSVWWTRRSQLNFCPG